MQQTVDAFLSWLVEEKGSTNNTIAAYRNDLGQFLTWVQAHTTADAWDAIAEGDIRAYQDELQARNYAPTTVARKTAAVRSFFHYLALTGALDDDPTVNITAGAPVRPSPERLSRRAAQRLLDSVPDNRPLDLRDRALIAFIAGAGLKASGVTALDLADVTPQPGEEQTPVLPSAVTTELARYLAQGRPALAGEEDAAEEEGTTSKAAPHRPLFLNARGGRLSRQGLWVVLKRRGEDAGLGDKVSPRSLRGVLGED